MMLPAIEKGLNLMEFIELSTENTILKIELKANVNWL